MRVTRLPRRPAAAILAACTAALLATVSAPAGDLDPALAAVEARRAAVIAKVRPSVVAIFGPGGAGGGSGVLVTEDGYALTNFHVVEGAGPVMKCGLPDGVLYDAVLVGTDKVGDVALIKLLPQKEGDRFPVATMGDSDRVKAGDWSLAMGNPFLLATDFTPTVTFGLVSGVHRYQYPAGTLLEYTDCIQIDTSINPGNSGGPLFNLDGELIGINGRGSFEKRGRVNSGVGYAISINQIKNFMGHLRAGLDADHATLGAVVGEVDEAGASNQMVVTRILEDSDAYRRGLEPDDELVSFAGRPISSVNHFKNVLGLYPKGWRMPLVYRRQNEQKEILVRLMGVQAQELIDPNRPRPGGPDEPRRPRRPTPTTPASKFYQAKAGFANFYFNKQARDRMLAAFKKHGDFTSQAGPWLLEAKGKVKDADARARFVVADEKNKEGVVRPVVRYTLNDVDLVTLEPLKKLDPEELREPEGSGGLLVALYHYRLLLTAGEKGFEADFSHGGHEPFYPPGGDPKDPQYLKRRVDTEVLRTEHNGVSGKWYFSLKDQTLLGFEVWIEREDDPCEVYLSDYRSVDGRMLPHRIEVRHGDDGYAALDVTRYVLSAGK